MRNRKKYRINGFTLLEVIVNLAIMMIVVSVSGTMLVSGMNIFYKNAEMLERQNIVYAVSEFISDNIMYAEKISSEGNENSKSIVCSDGQIYVKYEDETEYINAFGEEFYNSYTVSYSIDITGNSADIIVNLYDYDNSHIYSSEKSVILLNKPESDIAFIENSEINIY